MFGRSQCKMLFAVLLLLLATPSLLYAGWLVKDADGSTTYISDGKIKYVEAEAANSFLVMDYRGDRVIMVDGGRKAYAAGSMDAYCGVMQQMLAAFGEMEAAFGGAAEESAAPSVRVVAAGKETVAGMAADKYKVLVDGDLYEEVWLASDGGPMQELKGTDGPEQMMECLGEGDDPVESSAAYRDLSLKGWELRNVSYEFGEKEYNTNVVEIKQTAIADSVFDVPAGYRKMTFEAFFNSGAE